MSETQPPVSPRPAAFARALELAGWLAVLAVAGVARLWDLDLKPLHSDESMNAFFLRRLIEEGVYEYKATDFHGPLLYFASALPLKLAGPGDASLRFATACAGIASVAAMRLFRSWIGRAGALAAAALLALSAPDVYFARTSIHETWFVLCGLLAAAASLAALRDGARRHFVAAGVGWALAAATKETVVITAAGFAVGLAAALWAGSGARELGPARVGEVGEWLRRHARDMAAGGAAAAITLVLLFTSGLTAPRGLVSMFEAAAPWIEYGVSGRNQAKPFGYFASLWGWWAPVLLFALPGAVWGVVRRNRFAIFAATWFGSMWLAYELIPYKTPWCALALALPLFPLAGHAVRSALAAPALRGPRGPLLLAALLAAALAEGARATYDASFVRYDDPRIPFVYVQTRAGFMDLVEDLDGLRRNRHRAEGSDAETRVFAVEPKNPLRWYLWVRGWPDAFAGFANNWPREGQPKRTRRVRDGVREADVVMVPQQWEANALRWIDGADYVRRTYPGRPGTTYVLLVRREIARYLPAHDRPRVDGGGDVLVKRPPAPRSPLPFLRDLGTRQAG